MGIEQVCERINDTFVVKCIDQIRLVQEPIQVVIKQPLVPPELFWTFGLPELINAVLIVISLGLAYWGFKIARDAAEIAKDANHLAKAVSEATLEHNAQSIRPALNWEINKSSIYGYNIILKNSGLGPAFISVIDVYLDDLRLGEIGYSEFNNDFEILGSIISDKYNIPEVELEYKAPSIAVDSVIGVGSKFEWYFYINHRSLNGEEAGEYLKDSMCLWIEYKDTYDNIFEEYITLK